MIIPDGDDYDDTDAKARMAAMNPTHMKDITHGPLCIYMEFLTRLLDARRIQDRRWFLSLLETFYSKLKGKR
jgi:hypothetical protein